MAFQIRKMTVADRDGKAYVHWKSWQETYQGYISNRFLDKWTYEKGREIAVRFPRNTIVAEDNGKIVGFAAYGRYREEDGTESEEAGEVYAIYVLKEYQRKKTGYRLMNSCFKLLANQSRIYVWVLKENSNAIQFYTRYGFEPDGMEKDLLFDPETPNTEIRMVYSR